MYEFNWDWRKKADNFFVTKYSSTDNNDSLDWSINLNETKLFNEFHEKKLEVKVDQEQLNYLDYIKKFKTDFENYNLVLLDRLKENSKNTYAKDKIKEFETKYFTKYISERFQLERLLKQKKEMEINREKKLMHVIGKKQISQEKTNKNTLDSIANRMHTTLEKSGERTQRKAQTLRNASLMPLKKIKFKQFIFD